MMYVISEVAACLAVMILGFILLPLAVLGAVFNKTAQLWGSFRRKRAQNNIDFF